MVFFTRWYKFFGGDTRNSAYFSISSLPGDIPPLVSSIEIRLTQQQCKKKRTKNKKFFFWLHSSGWDVSTERRPRFVMSFFLLLNDDQSSSAAQDYSTVYKCSCWRESTWSFAKSPSLSQDVYIQITFSKFLVWFFLCNCAALWWNAAWFIEIQTSIRTSSLFSDHFLI